MSDNESPMPDSATSFLTRSSAVPERTTCNVEDRMDVENFMHTEKRRNSGAVHDRVYSGLQDQLEASSRARAQLTTHQVPEPQVQTPAVSRPTLSARIQQAVDISLEDLKAKVTDVEQCVMRQKEALAERDAELEAKLFERMEAMLAGRDTEIQALRAELEAERSWRTS